MAIAIFPVLWCGKTAVIDILVWALAPFMASASASSWSCHRIRGSSESIIVRTGDRRMMQTMEQTS